MTMPRPSKLEARWPYLVKMRKQQREDETDNAVVVRMVQTWWNNRSFRRATNGEFDSAVSMFKRDLRRHRDAIDAEIDREIQEEEGRRRNRELMRQLKRERQRFEEGMTPAREAMEEFERLAAPMREEEKKAERLLRKIDPYHDFDFALDPVKRRKGRG